jgi:hypothetical protein
MNFDAIYIQGHIPNWDPQGNLTAEQKHEMFSLSLKHIRTMNPNSYIALVGHGDIKPDNCYMMDWVHWDKAWPIDAGGLVVGQPAQYRWLGIGADHLRDQGFDYCLKTRLDSLIGRPNITNWCQDIVESEEKDCLITQMTGEPGFLGDCFFYGNINLLHHMWNPNNRFVHSDGLVQTAHFFRDYYKSGDPWKQLLKEKCAFRDLWEIPFMDMRWTFHSLNAKRSNWKQEVFDDYNSTSIYRDYLWGRANGWHVFDDQGKMISTSRSEMWSKEQFYA